jgi:hypothetical protein
MYWNHHRRYSTGASLKVLLPVPVSWTCRRVHVRLLWGSRRIFCTMISVPVHRTYCTVYSNWDFPGTEGVKVQGTVVKVIDCRTMTDDVISTVMFSPRLTDSWFFGFIRWTMSRESGSSCGTCRIYWRWYLLRSCQWYRYARCVMSVDCSWFIPRSTLATRFSLV